MKKLLFLLFLPSLAWSSYSKPELLARFNFTDSWNVPSNVWCFSGEPTALKGEVFLNCMDGEGSFMGRWNQKGFQVVARGENGNLISYPVISFNRMVWSEYSEFSPARSFVSTDSVHVRKITNLGPLASSFTDSFLPLTKESFIFKNKGEETQLWLWKDNQVVPFFNPEAAYLFTMATGTEGQLALKVRYETTAESGPDHLMLYENGSWKSVLKDQDADSLSKWKSFRHQLSVDLHRVLVMAHDGKSEHLLLIDSVTGKETILATAGKELKSFDYFSPKVRGGTVVVRGEDFSGRKALYIHDEEGFRKILAQGDIVQTDHGPARVHYKNPHAIFYGAAGLDENRNIYLQVTLTDPDYPETLMGVGLIKFTKE